MGRKQAEVGEGRWAKPGGCACWGGAAGVLISQSPCVHWSLHSFPGRGWQGSGILGVPAPTPVSASGSSRSFSGGWDSPLASRQSPAPVCPCPSPGPLPASPQSPAERACPGDHQDDQGSPWAWSLKSRLACPQTPAQPSPHWPSHRPEPHSFGPEDWMTAEW